MKDDLLSSNRDLLQRFRRGESAALAETWKWYRPMVRTLAVNGFGDFKGFKSTFDLDDAVAATFAAAFEERSRLAYDGITPFSKYLFGIGRNVMRRLWLAQVREPTFELDSAKATDGTSFHTPEEELITKQQQELLKNFSKTLDGLEIDVFQGYFGSGLSEEKLANRLGITRHAVRKQLVRLFKKMRRFVRDVGLIAR